MSTMSVNQIQIQQAPVRQARLNERVSRLTQQLVQMSAELVAAQASLASAMAESAPVWVYTRRSSGEPLRTYHRTDNHCRKVTPRYFDKILESQAVARGLRLCDACAGRAFADPVGAVA